MLDSLPSFLGGNQAAFIGGLHSLLQDAAGCRAYLKRRLITDKWIHALGLSHNQIVTGIGVWCKRMVEELALNKVHLSPGDRFQLI